MKTEAGFLMACALTFGVATAFGASEETYEAFGMRFWKALSQADFQALETCYAPEVTLLAGSELLKKEWGINPGGDRGKDLQLKRADLLAGYKTMVAKIGIEKWKEALSKIGKDKVSFAAAEKDDQFYKGVRKGDIRMKVAAGPGDDALFFVLSQNADKAWCVRMERTDY